MVQGAFWENAFALSPGMGQESQHHMLACNAVLTLYRFRIAKLQRIISHCSQWLLTGFESAAPRFTASHGLW